MEDPAQTAPVLFTTEEYRRYFIGVIGELNALLGLQLRPRGTLTGPIGEQLAATRSFHECRDRSNRDWNLARLGSLVMELHDIQAHDPKLLNAFRRRLRKASSGEFSGIRFEVMVARLLIDRRISFTRQESPDFLIHGFGLETGIECTGAQLAAPKDKDLKYKVRSAVSSHAGKTYVGPNVALVVDITNVQWHNDQIIGERYTVQSLHNFLLELTPTTRFGSIAVIIFVGQAGPPARLQLHGIRVDHERVTAGLRSCLDAMFPIGGPVPVLGRGVIVPRLV